MQVAQRLRLDALRGVHDEHCTFAGGERPTHLVGKVHVTGNQLGLDLSLPLSRVVHAHGRGFDRDTFFARSRSIVSSICSLISRSEIVPVSCSSRSAAWICHGQYGR